MKRLTVTSVALAALGLAACGGGSSDGGNQASGSTTAQRADIQACLKKHGIEAPGGAGGGPPPGGAPQGGGGAPPQGNGGGFPLGGGGYGPPGGNNSEFQKALKDCGIDTPRRQQGNRQNSPQFRAAIKKFVSCVRRNGFDLPDPNLSGDGPVFDQGKVDQSDPKFVAASKKCQDLLRPGRPAGSS
jgi:hypothetical protein